ncbi:MAG: lysophospholipid acyltransferase family protein [Bacteroidetes bacterium]|nr:lysophospholipid acyltransferase family protein [Bacteroidota bacterium]
MLIQLHYSVVRFQRSKNLLIKKNIFAEYFFNICFQYIWCFNKVFTFKISSARRKIPWAVFFYLIPIRKQTAVNNLKLCFPSENERSVRKIIKECYINLGIDLLEFFYFPYLNSEKISRFVFFHNYETVDEALKINRGVLFLSGHYSNWELTAFSYSRIYNRSLKIIAKPQGGGALNEKINSYRTAAGNEIIQTGYSLRTVFEKLSNNDILCFLIDQSANPDYSVYIDFLGQHTSAFSGPAKIALKKRPELILAYGRRNKNYSYDIHFEKINYEDITDNNNESIKILTQRIQTAFEKIILEDPGQWLWLHKRFKHVRKEN